MDLSELHHLSREQHPRRRVYENADYVKPKSNEIRATVKFNLLTQESDE